MSAAPGAARDPTAAEAVRRAAATPLQVDVDDLENKPALSDNADSPTKRTRWDVQRPPPAGSAPSPVSGISLADLTAALAPLTAGVTEMRQRLTEVENQFTTKVGKTLDMVQELNQRQKDQGVKIQQLQDDLHQHR